MLTDIFAYRYSDQPIWHQYTELEKRLLNQSINIVKDFIPYYTVTGSENAMNRDKWKMLHDQLARELGVNELSSRYYFYNQKNAFGQEIPVSGSYSWLQICEHFINENCVGQSNPDRFIKERISFVELAFRLRGDEVAQANSKSAITSQARSLLYNTTPRFSLGNLGSETESMNAMNRVFEGQVDELNERFRRANAPLTYHNGFIQFAMDQQIEKHIAKPFWDLVAGPLWKNVDIDMKEALDRRDANDKDPAIFAAKALESAIKIVSDTKRMTTGTEKGAANFVDNLVSKKNGSFLSVWEGEMLKDYFRKVRNSLGHGPGSDPMPELTLPQTDWAIETAMSWVRTIVRRM